MRLVLAIALLFSGSAYAAQKADRAIPEEWQQAGNSFTVEPSAAERSRVRRMIDDLLPEERQPAAAGEAAEAVPAIRTGK